MLHLITSFMFLSIKDYCDPNTRDVSRLSKSLKNWHEPLMICFICVRLSKASSIFVLVFGRTSPFCQVIAGSETVLQCQFLGSPQPEVDWLKDGGPLEENERVVCTVDQDVACLRISNAEPDDEGWYRCRISNELGAVSAEAEVIVVEVPTFVNGLEDLKIDEGKDRER